MCSVLLGTRGSLFDAAFSAFISEVQPYHGSFIFAVCFDCTYYISDGVLIFRNFGWRFDISDGVLIFRMAFSLSFQRNRDTSRFLWNENENAKKSINK